MYPTDQLNKSLGSSREERNAIFIKHCCITETWTCTSVFFLNIAWSKPESVNKRCIGVVEIVPWLLLGYNIATCSTSDF